jgi:hypothetical protein
LLIFSESRLCVRFTLLQLHSDLRGDAAANIDLAGGELVQQHTSATALREFKCASSISGLQLPGHHLREKTGVALEEASSGFFVTSDL